MATLKDLRVRITSVKSTQKITSAMKMVAASKLRRAQTQAEAARPYAQRMERMLASLGASVAGSPTAPKLLAGTGGDKVHLLVPVTGERGLAGAFNSNVGRLTRNLARKLESEGKTVKILAVGRKGRDYLRREIGSRLIGDISFAGKKTIGFAEAQEIAARITQLLDDGAFDVCTVVYNRFQSVISQIPTPKQLIPAVVDGDAPPIDLNGATYVERVVDDHVGPACGEFLKRHRGPASQLRGVDNQDVIPKGQRRVGISEIVRPYRAIE